MNKAVFVISLFLVLTSSLLAQRRPKPDGGFDDNGFSSDTQTDSPKGGLKGGKLLDDSTKQIYGPLTTRYTFENNIKYNQEQYYYIDTLIEDLHRFSYVNKANNQLQDLGNIGTAAMPMFYQLPSTIGVSSGINIYDIYFKTADQIKYYNTYSPFTNMDIVIGGNGRAITDASYSRNISPQWNFGFDFRGLYIDKQIQRSGKGDRNVAANAYNLYSSYKTKNDKYQMLWHLSRNMHRVNEYGGVAVEDVEFLSDFFADNADNILEEAKTQELRTNLHIYQQYKFSDFIQVYHQGDRSKQENTFRDTAVDSLFHMATYLDPKGTFDRTDFHNTTSEQGVKGDIGRLFYNFYQSTRYFDMDYNNIHRDTVDLTAKGFEQYGGAKVRLQLDSLTSIAGDLEFLVGGNYQFGAQFKSSKYAFEFRRMQYAPSFMEKYYYGNHHRWDNDFNSVKVDQLKGSLNLSLGRLSLNPFGKWTLLNDYIYYDRQRRPAQAGDLQLVNLGAEVNTNIIRNKIHLSAYGLYSAVKGSDSHVMRVPELLFNAKMYYQNMVFDGNLQFQFGVDAHWKSTYFANNYDPAIQQFHLQNDFPINEYAVVDIFMNLKINRGRLFLKYINLMKSFNEVGYFASPQYIGQVNGIDFGFKWAFYD